MPTYDIVMPCLIFFTIVSFSLISFINEIIFFSSVNSRGQERKGSLLDGTCIRETEARLE